MKDLKVVFMGTPEFAVPVLKELINNTNVVLVVTKEDAYVGRKHILTPSPVATIAENNNIKTFKPARLRDNYQEILDIKPDIIITCAYGQIVPIEVLKCAPLGAINVHASILPKYRGASPISAAIMNGDKESGVTIMYMDETLDTGDIISSKEIEIDDKDTTGTLTDKLSQVGAHLLMDTLPSIVNKTNPRIKQDDSLSSYVGTIKREDEHLDFNDTCFNIVNKIRALNPAPLANIKINDEEWKIISAEGVNKDVKESGIITEVGKDYIGITAKDGIVKITKIKPFGKKEMLVRDFLNGYKGELLNKKVG